MKHHKYNFIILIVLFSISIGEVFATRYLVGPSRSYKTPSAVAGILNDGDTVDIDAGEYTDCAFWSANNILIRGVGGFAHLRDKACGGKGIMNISGDNVTVEHIEFSGATVEDNNGAGIRHQGGSITVRHCFFHDNEDGILGAPTLPNAHFLIEYCEFSKNGAGGGGYAHNIYIGNYDSFTLQFSYSHDAVDGHEVKSRAKENYIFYNRITEEAGTSSRNIDLPNGGLAYFIGNIIEQGQNSENSNILGYGLEGLGNAEPHNLYVINNTFINNLGRGSFIDPNSSTNLLKVTNNIFAGQGTIIAEVVTTLDSSSNLVTPDANNLKFQDINTYDYRLTAESTVIDKGTDPGVGSVARYPLTPQFEYVNPLMQKNRTNDGKIDIGAYEFSAITAAETVTLENTNSLTIYPNPIGDATTISFYSDQDQKISLLLYDITGRKIAEIFSAEKAKGKYELTWNTFHLPSGIYLLYYKTSQSSKVLTLYK